MIDLRLTADTGDLDVSGGDLHLSSEDEAILQNIGTRFRFQQGEWFLNTLAGTPLFSPGGIFGSGRAELELVRAVVVQLIESTPGMKRVISLTMDLDANRVLKVTWEGQKASGLVIGPFTETLIFGDL